MSQSRSETRSRHRAAGLVGRSKELGWTERWLNSLRPETRVLFLTGIGGIGKSALLRRMAETARASGALVALLDLEMTGLSAPACLDALQRQVEFPPGSGFTPGSGLSGRRLFIGIDHYDDVGSLDDWLRNELLPQCPAEGCLVAIASRRGSRLAWGNDPTWSSRLMRFPLRLLSASEARELLGRIGTTSELSDAETDRLIRESQGLPLALVVNAQNPPAEIGRGRAPLRIASRLFREVTDPSLESAIEVLTVLHHADQELLSACLAEPVTASFYRRVSSLSMVTTSEVGLRLHSVIQEHLNRDLTLRAPHLKHRLIARALRALEARLNDPQSSADLRRLDGLNLLYLCRDGMGQTFSSEAGEGPEYSVEPLHQEDLPVLHEFLETAAREFTGLNSTAQLHEMLNVIAAHLPGALAVFKNGEGRTVAFSAAVPLHRESLPLLERFPIVANYVNSCSAADRQGFHVSPLYANTYFWFGGPAAGTPTHNASFWPQALRHALSLLAGGGRLIGIGGDPEALKNSAQLGFRPLDSGCENCGATRPLQYIELDLRQGRFAPWALAFMGAYLAQSGRLNSGNPAGGTGPTRGTDPSAEATSELAVQLRQALRGLQRPGRVGTATAARLRRLLTEQPPPAPLTSEQQELLRLSFLETGKQNNKAFAVASELNISRPTYFRRLNEAVLALAAAWSAGTDTTGL